MARRLLNHSAANERDGRPLLVGRRTGLGEVVRALGEGARHDDGGLDPQRVSSAVQETASEAIAAFAAK